MEATNEYVAYDPGRRITFKTFRVLAAVATSVGTARLRDGQAGAEVGVGLLLLRRGGEAQVATISDAALRNACRPMNANLPG
jgi:hypothetical protein